MANNKLHRSQWFTVLHSPYLICHKMVAYHIIDPTAESLSKIKLGSTHPWALATGVPCYSKPTTPNPRRSWPITVHPCHRSARGDPVWAGNSPVTRVVALSSRSSWLTSWDGVLESSDSDYRLRGPTQQRTESPTSDMTLECHHCHWATVTWLSNYASKGKHNVPLESYTIMTI